MEQRFRERERERVGSECVPVTRVIQISGICKTSQDSAVLALKYLKCSKLIQRPINDFHVWSVLGWELPVSFMLKQDVQKGPFKAWNRPTEGGPWTLNKIQVKQRWRITFFFCFWNSSGVWMLCFFSAFYLSCWPNMHSPLSCREDNAFGADEALPLFILIIISFLAVFMSLWHQPSGVDLGVVFLVKRSKDTRDNKTKQFLLCKSMDF